jgi:hypothetical protein
MDEQEPSGVEVQKVVHGDRSLLVLLQEQGVELPVRQDVPQDQRTPLVRQQLLRVKVTRIPNAYPLDNGYFIVQQYCRKCTTWKDPQDFTRDASSVTGLHSVCAACKRPTGLHAVIRDQQAQINYLLEQLQRLQGVNGHGDGDHH